ncbi:gamma-aminobutyrate transporter [Escherichia coli]|uniref:Gamma-aminobutyrate transporter n=1 Tax=Escherichia coli TaxID=562 RepID=A0A377AJZ3_ECOLX|nr:gamma-aminobutyrate transporter [Escherichia coli]
MVVNYYAPAKVFKFLIDSSGAIALLVYLVIAVSQLRMRKILRAEGSEIRLRMWLYPWLTWLVIGFITFVLVVMLFRPAQQFRSDLYRLISDRDYLYRADLWRAGKSWYCGKKHPFIIRADNDQESHHDHYVSGWLSLAEERYYSR